MFSQKLKQARISCNLKQAELAAKLRVKNTTISNWEKGVSSPDIYRIQELCHLLHISADYLLDTKEETLTPKEQQMIENYRSLDEYGKKAVDATLQLEFKRVCCDIENQKFCDVESAYAYLIKNPMFAIDDLDIEAMDKEALIKFANDQYEMDQRAVKLFK